MIKMGRYSTAYVKEVMGLMCQTCNNMITKCSSCGNTFSFSDRIYCATPEHICQNCYKRKEKIGAN
jgi:hypothetical protein